MNQDREEKAKREALANMARYRQEEESADWKGLVVGIALGAAGIFFLAAGCMVLDRGMGW